MGSLSPRIYNYKMVSFRKETNFIGNLLCLFYSVDTSDFMRNGDFVPTRLQAQQDAVNVITHSKTRSNPENNVGLLTLST